MSSFYSRRESEVTVSSPSAAEGVNYAGVRTATNYRGVNLLGRQRVDVSDLPGDGHGVTVDNVEVLLPKQQQTLAGVQTLDPGTAVHVLNLEGADVERKREREMH